MVPAHPKDFSKIAKNTLVPQKMYFPLAYVRKKN